MADNKKSFLLHCDLIFTISKLPDEKAGKLFKHILEYVNDKTPKNPEDLIIDIAFEPIKQSLKRDLKKYEKRCERNTINGFKGGRPKNPKEPTGLSGLKNKPKKADSDSDSDSDNENDSESRYSPEARDIADKLLESILSWKPDYKCPCKSVMLGWVDACDKAIRIDARKPERMLEIIKWLPSHEGRGGFTWRANVLSGTTLRKQFDRLDIAINEDNKPVSRHGSGEYEQVIDIPEVQ